MKLISSLLVLALFLIPAILGLAASFYKPWHNWDMIMYIAAAKSYEEQNIDALHDFTYKAVRASVSEAEYNYLLQGEPRRVAYANLSAVNEYKYRQAIYTDPSAFKEQLPFYQIRPLYTGTIYLLYKAGVDIGRATHMISAIAVAVALLFLYFLSISFLPTPFAVAVPFLAIIFDVTDLARNSTPDGMAFLAMMVTAYLYLTQRISLLLILLPITLGVRTDLILFVIPLLLLIFSLHKKFRRKVIASLLASLLFYIAIVTHWQNPGWSVIFYHTFIQLQAHPLSMLPTLTPSHYFSAFLSGVRKIANDRIFWLYLVVVYFLFLTLKYEITHKSFPIRNLPLLSLSAVCLIFIVSHFLLFPIIWTRFFTGPYLISAFVLLEWSAGCLKRVDHIE